MAQGSKPKEKKDQLPNEAIEWAIFFYSLYQQKKLQSKK